MQQRPSQPVRIGGSLIGASFSTRTNRGQPNRWCIPGMFDIYHDGFLKNDKGKSFWGITKERCNLTAGLAAVPEIRDLFSRHRCDGIAAPSGQYNLNMVREFYTSYAVMMTNTKLPKTKEIDQSALQSTFIWRVSVDILECTIWRFFYGKKYEQTASTAEYDNRMNTVWDQNIMKDPTQKNEVLKWVVGYIAEHRVDAEWVSGLVPIKKTIKIWWLIVRYRLSLTMADNHLTLDHVVMVASIMAIYNIDFARCIIAEIHEREFWHTMIIPFPYLIYRICRDSEILIILGANQLIEVSRT